MKVDKEILKKIKSDRFYNKVFEKYNDFNILLDAGFIDSKIEAKDYYNLNLLTTPVDKILGNLDNIKNPVVLLSTGGFLPIHDGHINMMQLAKCKLEELGYNVVGGYFSPSHEDYVSTKPNYYTNLGSRLFECQKAVSFSEWLMIDPWECQYVKSYINFTSVIDRLELYLQKHIDNRIKVAYVFGGDNAKFNYCFEDDGIGICINRKNNNKEFLDAKAKISNKNCIFIENNSETAQLSSRYIRNKDSQTVTIPIEGEAFLIRDEGLLPFKHYISKINEKTFEDARKNFLEGLIALFQNEFGFQHKVKTAKVEKQIKQAQEILSSEQTISIDSYFRGNFNLEISRLFACSSPQFRYKEIVARANTPTLNSQISNIKDGTYTLVDDDSVSGSTLKSIKSLLPIRINIDKIFLLSSLLNEKFFDVVDFRDFIVGANNSGLTVSLPNGQITRVPYMLPYTNLTTRASIAPNRQYQFSIRLWELNKDFFKSLGNKLLLSDADKDFKTLMHYIGFNDNDTLEDICKWHIEKLRQEIK